MDDTRTLERGEANRRPIPKGICTDWKHNCAAGSHTSTQGAPKKVAAEVTSLKYFGGLLVRSIIPPGSMSVRR